MNYITSIKWSFLAQDVLRNGQVKIYKSCLYKANKKEKKYLAYAQNGKGTNPPPMVSDEKRDTLRL